MPKERVISLTAKDFRWDYFRCGGHGGQKVNKTSAGCRCTHVPSGAVGQATDTRHQHQNRRLAFERCVATKEFRAWLYIEHARRAGLLQQIEASVDEELKHVRVEVRDADGRWVADV